MDIRDIGLDSCNHPYDVLKAGFIDIINDFLVEGLDGKLIISSGQKRRRHLVELFDVVSCQRNTFFGPVSLGVGLIACNGNMSYTLNPITAALIRSIRRFLVIYPQTRALVLVCSPLLICHSSTNSLLLPYRILPATSSVFSLVLPLLCWSPPTFC